jgi:small-conductance mechanosensitive channel
VNWTHSDQNVRRKIPVQISYDSDLKLAMALLVEAANEHPRTLKYPESRCLIKGFGSDGVDLELRMWINDPYNGVSNIASDIMETIWDKFHRADIEFPFPQRVVHVKYDQDITRKPQDE